MNMKCFARWEQESLSGACFRDQTILQFGDSWELLASFVLLNPGSALPLDTSDQSEYLRSKSLPFFVEPSVGEAYLEFSIDRLMGDVIKLFACKYSGGTIRLLNLFNLKNQDSNEAVEQLLLNQSHAKMFSKDHEIVFFDAPVIIASGDNANNHLKLKPELIRHISLAKAENLYRLAVVNNKQFSIVQAAPDSKGLIYSYHPSYTFKYGNTTDIGDLCA
jgi:hypothetical protein